MSAGKFYVVWKGKQPGIYRSWTDCQAQVKGYKDAKFKSYKTKKEAEVAYEQGPSFSGRDSSKKRADEQPSSDMTTNYIADSLSVDAACSGNPGLMEYRGVCTKTNEEIFHYGPVENGTNNIGEFLAIVHGLAFLQKKNSQMPIYSDSQTALSWVRNKKANTTIARNSDTEQLWSVIDRAEDWLRNNDYTNEILKWDTVSWGESKADFGRK